MRVTITYSTELQEVPEECYALLSRLGEDLIRINESIQQSKQLYDDLAENPSNESRESLLRPLSAMYHRLTNSATRIKDCMMLLDGFVTTSLNPSSIGSPDLDDAKQVSEDIDQMQEELQELVEVDLGE